MNHNASVREKNVCVYKEKSAVNQERDQVMGQSAEGKTWFDGFTTVSISLTGRRALPTSCLEEARRVLPRMY